MSQSSVPPVLVLGAGGLFGPYLRRAARANGAPVIGVSRTLPVEVPCALWIEGDLVQLPPAPLLEQLRPGLVIFNAALADAEVCEREPAASRAMNCEVPARWAAATAQHGARFVFVSTDLVFDGEHAPYAEEAAIAPRSVYGRDKADGERAVLDANPGALVVRPPMLLGLHPKRGLIVPLLRALRERRVTPHFTDEFRAPLACDEAAAAVLQLAACAQGLLHIGGATTLSRYALAQRIAHYAHIEQPALRPCLRSDLNLVPPRPADLTLDCRRAYALGFQPGSFDQQLARLVAQAG